jgi:hypothetical protein
MGLVLKLLTVRVNRPRTSASVVPGPPLSQWARTELELASYADLRSFYNKMETKESVVLTSAPAGPAKPTTATD